MSVHNDSIPLIIKSFQTISSVKDSQYAIRVVVGHSIEVHHLSALTQFLKGMHDIRFSKKKFYGNFHIMQNIKI
jgi:hypothetical protein